MRFYSRKIVALVQRNKSEALSPEQDVRRAA
jgi:hypothetical protein